MKVGLNTREWSERAAINGKQYHGGIYTEIFLHTNYGNLEKLQINKKGSYNFVHSAILLYGLGYYYASCLRYMSVYSKVCE